MTKKKSMDNEKVLKLVTAIGETVLAVPLLGGLLVVSTLWITLGIMLVLHILTLIFCNKRKLPITGNIIGIVASVLGIIPVLGWILHIVTAVFLWLEFNRMN
ncbi:hypothetical protein KY312_02845 [Candidatus Woesearchaeota archaeon]|nr:hypothetical protein [Candidatus Woesearchaeota archaeon]